MTATDAGGQAVAQKEVKVLGKSKLIVLAKNPASDIDASSAPFADKMISLSLPTAPVLISTDAVLFANVSTQNGTQVN